METMTALSRQYRLEAAKISLAIQKLEQQRAALPPGEARAGTALRNRRQILETMLRELREVSRYLEHYYDAQGREYFPCLSGMAVRTGVEP